jgi:protease-4
MTAFLLTIFIVFILVVAVASSGKKGTTVHANSVLTIKLDKAIPERPVDNPLADVPFIGSSVESDMPVSLKEILDNIKYAKTDNNIKGIYLDMDLVQAGLPTLEEIRNALIDFRKSGKFVYSYAELYTQKSYYLASVSDSIFLNKTGLFSFAGFHSEQIFFKGLLDKLEIKPVLIRVGKYKSAGETFIKDSMSAPNREQTMAYMNSSYDYFLKNISDARHVPVEDLRNIANNGLIRFPADAVHYMLIDRDAYEDEVMTDIMNKLGEKKLKDVHKISMEDYNKVDHHKTDTKGKANIALIYAVGEISGGEGSADAIGSDKLSQAIRDAREDDDIKAIVLRINSPGGSALASDVIWREVMLARQKKPVIASFGDVAASGGYYIAAPATKIYAEPNTITGSIGVFGLLPNLKDFWKDKLGITWDRAKTGKYADIGNPNRPMTPDEVNIIQGYVNATYEDFKLRVAEGRHLDTAFVQSIAQGHVYSAIQAKDLKLVDAFGNMDDAIADAAKMANLSSYELKIMPEYKAGYLKASQSMASSHVQSQMEAELQKNYALLQKISEAEKMGGIMMYMPYDLDIH